MLTPIGEPTGSTPGPWEIGAESREANEIEIMQSERPYRRIAHVLSYVGPYHSGKENAYLMAQAPAMAGLLRELAEGNDGLPCAVDRGLSPRDVNGVACDCWACDWVTRARVVLEKAHATETPADAGQEEGR